MPRQLRVEFPLDPLPRHQPGRMAARLRRETTLTLGFIAQRLQMGTRQSAAMKLHRWGKERGEPSPGQAKTMV